VPLCWIRGRNPFRHNYFGVLGVGPNTPNNHIFAIAKKLARRDPSPELDGQPLDAHVINDAAGKLLESRSMVEELLLVHADPSDDRKRHKKIFKEIREAAALPAETPPLTLAHPLAVLWFLPTLEADIIPVPELEELRLTRPGDAADAACDIVFDG